MTSKKEKKTKKRAGKVKPEWTTVIDPEYREYFVTQAQISRSIRNDDVVHLTFYDECIPHFPDKKKRPSVERKIKTKLVLPYNAVVRLKMLLERIIAKKEDGAGEQARGGELSNETESKETELPKESGTKGTDTKDDTPYIR